VRFLRALLLLVVLVPLVGLAAPCCSDSVAADCCETSGDCSAAPDGACVLTADAAPGVSVSTRPLTAPPSLSSGTESILPAAWRPAANRLLPQRGRTTPIFLALRSIRI
jgi:hypothetical protein